MKLAFTLLAALTACGDGSEPDLAFSALSDAELARLADAALGFDVVGAGLATNLGDSDPCPARTIDSNANSLTLVGGCTRANGGTIDGTAVITNPPQIIDGLHYYASANTLLQFTGYHVQLDDFEAAFEGEIDVTPEDDTTMSIDASLQGLTVHSDLSESCHGTGMCDVLGSISYNGLAAAVTGTVPHDGDAEGHVAAAGADTLEASWVDGCTWRLADGSRTGTCE